MSLTVVLDKNFNGFSIFMPGETIKGSVIADMDEDKTCDYMTLTFEGRADVEIIEETSESYTDSDGKSQSRRRTDVYRAQEIYLSVNVPLLGATKLPKGRTIFPFQYSLPIQSVPCTFGASHGSVHYDILVHMKRPIFTFDLHGSGSFIVEPLLDLNNVNLAPFGPIQCPIEEYVGGWCCFTKGEGDLVRMNVTVPKRHFIPGEAITFRVDIKNQTKALLLSGAMQLVMTVRCLAQGRVRGDERIVTQIAGPSVPPHSSQTWEVNNFVIPVLKPVGLPPSGLGGCNIIDVQYILRYGAESEEKGCCTKDDVSVVIPIILGTISPNR